MKNQLNGWLHSPQVAAVLLGASGLGAISVALAGGKGFFLRTVWLGWLGKGLFLALFLSTSACTFNLLGRWFRGLKSVPGPVPAFRWRAGLVLLFHLGLVAGMILLAVSSLLSWKGIILIREGSRLGDGDPDLKIIQQGFLAKPTLGGNSLTLEAVDPQYRVPGYKEGIASYLTLVDDRGWRREILTRRGPVKLGSVEVYQRNETGFSVALVVRGAGENQVIFIDFGRDEIEQGAAQAGEIRGLGRVEVRAKPLDVPAGETARGSYGVEIGVKENRTFLRAGEKMITPEGVELTVDDMGYWTGLTLEYNPVYPWLAGVLGMAAVIFAVSRFL